MSAFRPLLHTAGYPGHSSTSDVCLRALVQGWEERAARWHVLGLGPWPPFLPNVLQTLEMVVGSTVSAAPSLAWPVRPGARIAPAFGPPNFTSCWSVWTMGAIGVRPTPGHRSLAFYWGTLRSCYPAAGRPLKQA